MSLIFIIQVLMSIFGKHAILLGLTKYKFWSDVLLVRMHSGHFMPST